MDKRDKAIARSCELLSEVSTELGPIDNLLVRDALATLATVFPPDAAEVWELDEEDFVWRDANGDVQAYADLSEVSA